MTIDPVKLVRRNIVPLAASGIAGVVIGIGAYFALRTWMPRYESATVFEATRPDVQDNPMSLAGEETDRFIAGQVQWLQERGFATLLVQDPTNLAGLRQYAREFVERHSSGGVFDAQAAAEDLDKQIIRASPIAETNFFRLAARHESPDLAYGLARAATEAYIRRRKEIERAEGLDRRRVLETGIRQAQQDRQDKIVQRQNELGLAETIGTLNQLHQALLVIERQISEIREEGGRLGEMLAYLEGMNAPGVTLEPTNEQLSRAQMRPEVQSLTQQINSLQTSLEASRNRGLSEQHRTIQALLSQIAAAEAQKKVALRQAAVDIYHADVESARQALRQNETVLAELAAETERLRGLIAQRERIDQRISVLTEDIQRLGRAVEEQQSALADLATQSTLRENTPFVSPQAPAMRPDSMAFPKPIPVVALSVFLCSGLVGGLIFLREMLDQRVRGPGDIKLIPGATLLGFLPAASEDPESPSAVETAFRDRPHGALAESFRQLRTPLLKQMDAGPHRSLLFVSAAPGSGATTTLTNLAYAAAAAGRRVLIVDANFRRPSLHTVLGVSQDPGLSDVLAGAAIAETAVQHVEESIHLIAAGTEGHRLPERLGSDAMRRFLEEAGGSYDLVLVDSSPASVSGDTRALAQMTDASLLVCRPRSEKRGLVGRLVGEFRACDAEFLGVIVNGVQGEAGGYLRENIRAAHAYHARAAK